MTVSLTSQLYRGNCSLNASPSGMPPAFRPREDDYVDTPRGIFTASGTWYNTTEERLREYAESVLDRQPLSVLLQQSDVWLRSAETATLWTLPILLLFVTPPAAAVGSLILYVGWKSLAPSFVFLSVIAVFRWLDVVLAQAFFYVFTLSWLAGINRYTAVWVGLAGFIILRWGLLAWATRPVVRSIQQTLYSLPVPDHILRAVIIRYALKHNLSVPQLDRIKKSFNDPSS